MIPSLVEGRQEIVDMVKAVGAPIQKVLGYESDREVGASCWASVEIDEVRPDVCVWSVRIYVQMTDAGPARAALIRDRAVDAMESALEQQSTVGPSVWRFDFAEEVSCLVAATTLERQREDSMGGFQ